MASSCVLYRDYRVRLGLRRSGRQVRERNRACGDEIDAS
jgi:hypothetical protein